jgi:hypothetical protein
MDAIFKLGYYGTYIFVYILGMLLKINLKYRKILHITVKMVLVGVIYVIYTRDTLSMKIRILYGEPLRAGSQIKDLIARQSLARLRLPLRGSPQSLSRTPS